MNERKKERVHSVFNRKGMQSSFVMHCGLDSIPTNSRVALKSLS